MGVIVQAVKDITGIGTTSADKAAKTQVSASKDLAETQKGILDFLKEANKPIQEAQTGALDRLGELAKSGLNPDKLQTEEQLLSGIEDSPIFQQIMGTLGAGEEAVLRNQAMTGGYRSGGTQQNLANLAANTKRNAILGAFQNRQQRDLQQIGLNQQGLQNKLGLESTILGLPNQIGNIAGTMGQIGNTLAQGQLGAAQTKLQGAQGALGNILNLGSLGVAAFSDRRLKENIQKIGNEKGFNVYTWDWNKEAKEKLGLSGQGRGVIADEVKKTKPEAVKSYSGYDTVNYEMIGVKHG